MGRIVGGRRTPFGIVKGSKRRRKAASFEADWLRGCPRVAMATTDETHLPSRRPTRRDRQEESKSKTCICVSLRSNACMREGGRAVRREFGWSFLEPKSDVVSSALTLTLAPSLEPQLVRGPPWPKTRPRDTHLTHLSFACLPSGRVREYERSPTSPSSGWQRVLQRLPFSQARPLPSRAPTAARSGSDPKKYRPANPAVGRSAGAGSSCPPAPPSLRPLSNQPPLPSSSSRGHNQRRWVKS